MKLVHIESNNPTKFGPIAFRDGLNVVFARVKDPTALQRSSHNLGKSFLMNVLDFVLGGDVDKDDPFKKRKDLFGTFVFILQVQANDGRFVSVRRPVVGRADCSVLVTEHSVSPGSYPDPREWTWNGLGLEDFKDRLNGLFALNDLEPYSFRKGLGYQLRGQSDYDDEFFISKFSRGRDRDWRPFVAKLLGFPQDVFLRGYDIEDRITNINKLISELENTDNNKKQQYDEVRGLIEIREAEIKGLRDELSIFKFSGVERKVSQGLVADVEAKIAELNVRRYTIDRNLADIERSLSTSFAFDLDLVTRVYREAGVDLPGQLVREMAEVAEFNRRISTDRNARLLRLKNELLDERAANESQVDQLDSRRQDALAVLREEESFAKYRQLTDQAFALEFGLRELRERLARLKQATTLRSDLSDKEKELLEQTAEIESAVQGTNEFFSHVRHLFNTAVYEILGARALLSVGLNKAHHIEFKTKILDDNVWERETCEGDGTSYKKLLCACVDLALLQAHSAGAYFRFAYHDGVFEGLDNRKKVALLSYVRGVCARDKLQYILTVIDSDLPRDERDDKQMFDPDEIILPLHDGGDDGRLFRMQKF